MTTYANEYDNPTFHRYGTRGRVRVRARSEGAITPPTCCVSPFPRVFPYTIPGYGWYKHHRESPENQKDIGKKVRMEA